MPKQFRGYAPILATPFRADGEIDLAAMKRLVEYLIASGAHGLSPCGWASESRHLAESERMTIVDTVMEANAGRVPVCVGASAPSTEESARLCRHAQAAGADAVFVMPPANWRASSLLEPKVPDDEMLAHYQAICDGLDIPLMVHASGAMDVPFLETLRERVPNVKYVKEESTMHGAKLRHYCQALGGRISIFGPGSLYTAELEWGAAGVMPPCIAPWTRARVFDLWQEGKRREARQMWNRMLPLHYWLMQGAAIEAGKMFLIHEGAFDTYYMRPDAETEALKQVAPLVLEEADRQEMLKALEDMGERPY
jgi:4-hydroxy-tetrahydrodipicolinate synthase